MSTLVLHLVSIDGLLMVLLTFGRVGGLLQAMPILSLGNVPIPVRVGLGLMMSVLVAAGLPAPTGLSELSAVHVGVLFVSETVLGLGMGFTATLLLSVIDVAGSFVGMNSGLAVAMQFDPMSGGQSLVVTRILQLAAFLTFLALDLHHEMFLGLADSFAVAPPGKGVLAFAAGEQRALQFAAVLHDAVRISMPVVATALFVNLVAALVTRFAQQMNIYFSVGR